MRAYAVAFLSKLLIEKCFISGSKQMFILHEGVTSVGGFTLLMNTAECYQFDFIKHHKCSIGSAVSSCSIRDNPYWTSRGKSLVYFRVPHLTDDRINGVK